MINERSEQRVRLAALNTPTTTHREAAIIGGVVQSLVRTRKLDMGYIKHAAKAAMEWSPDNVLGTGNYMPDRSWPTDEEVVELVARFRRQYDPPAEVAA